MVRLFDIVNKQVVPTEHCYTLFFLSRIMDEYPDNYMKIFAYLFYMNCPNPDLNPFFHVPDTDKEEMVLKEVRADFSTDDDAIVEAMDTLQKMYETETSRAYYGIKQALDNIAQYMKTTQITDGRDGNISQIRATAKDFDSIRQSYKGVYKDLMEEQQSTVRGGQKLAYDN